jgi:menaquinone-specific isochorismate synthase
MMTSAFAIERRQSVMSDRIQQALALARRLMRPALLSHVELLSFAPDPIAFLAASSEALGAGTLWAQPGAGKAFSGAGSAFVVRADGPGTFGQLAAAMSDLKQRLIRDEDAAFPCIGGLAFAESAQRGLSWRDFPAAMLIVPEVLLQSHSGGALLRITVQVEPGSSPGDVERHVQELLGRARHWATTPLVVLPHPTNVRSQSVPRRDAWESSVATAVAMIREGELDKIVLAREERLLADRPFSPISALARLRRADSMATLYAIQSGSSWFIGATPERLVRLKNDRVEVTCLAGSIGVGTNEREQGRLAAQLLASEKDREEHEIVVRSTVCALAEVCENVTRLTETPRVTTARSVQHLETLLTAVMPDAGNVLDLVERLHPTAAVGGHPRDRALSMIRELEEIDRGWYAGPFGWMDLDGSGEFEVAIRSGMLSGTTASLFAGCGIVAASVPSDEYEESCLKLRPMLSALGAG